jgi:hypothetical protein
MPKTEIDYSNSVIYKIACKDASCKELYVGHTTNFVQKKHWHKQCCTNNNSANYNLKIHKMIRETGGWDNWDMEIVHLFNCTNRNEAKKKELEYFALLHATMNSVQSTLTPQLEKKTVSVENMNNKTVKNEDVKLVCSSCNYSTTRKSSMDKHKSSAKHEINNKVANGNIQLTNGNTEVAKNKSYECKNCSKIYSSRVGIWKHSRICKTIENLPEENSKNDDLKILFLDMVKQNEEFKKLLIDQHKENHELHKKMLELQNNQSITNNNNGTINNTTNKFNLNFFLNETCKDAMNIQEFIDYVKVQHSDFENFGKYGYVESMTRIIMRNLMELEVHRRPIHCTDAKREVLYVKDNNVWVNDFSREKLIRAIKYIAAKNVKQIPGWMDHNPDSKNTQTKLHDKYMRMVCHSMGGRDEAEDQEYYKKIIHNLAKEVVIDKMK